MNQPVGRTDAATNPTARWDSLLGSPAWRQVVVICLTGAVVQALLWFRGDSAAHVVGGAALATFVGVSVPRRWLRRLDAWAEVVILAVMLGITWVIEQTVTGPFDALDVVFTVAGAFVGLAALPAWTQAGRHERLRLRVAMVALAGAALALRYLSGLGKA